MKRSFKAYLKCQSGATAVEYGIIIGMIVLVAIIGITALGSANEDNWDNVSDSVANAG